MGLRFSSIFYFNEKQQSIVADYLKEMDLAEITHMPEE